MTDEHRASATDTAVPNPTLSSSLLLNALDELSYASDLVELIDMTTAKDPCDEEKAISAGCLAIKQRLSKCKEFLERSKEAAQ